MSYDSERRELEIEAARDIIAAKDAEVAALREAMAKTRGYISDKFDVVAALLTIDNALSGSATPDLAENRRLRARVLELEKWTAADAVEAMRVRCVTIADAIWEDTQEPVAARIVRELAALEMSGGVT